MATIHDVSVCREDNGEGEVGLLDQLEVLHDPPPGDGLAVVPPRLIQFSNRRQRDDLSGQTPRELHQSIDVPREETAGRRAEVVLLAHWISRYGLTSV